MIGPLRLTEHKLFELLSKQVESPFSAKSFTVIFRVHRRSKILKIDISDICSKRKIKGKHFEFVVF